MRRAGLILSGVLLGLVIGVSISHETVPVAAAPVATAITPSSSPAASPSPSFSPKVMTVAVMSLALSGDPVPQQIANYLYANLAGAWGVATLQRSALILTREGPSEVLIVIDSSKNDRQLGWGLSTGSTRVVVLHQIADATNDTYRMAALHELGHVLGCCRGQGSDGEHETACPAPVYVGQVYGANVPIMCATGGFAPTFNDYELAQMGL